MKEVELQSVGSYIDSPFQFQQGESPLLISMPHCGVAKQNVCRILTGTYPKSTAISRNLA